MLQVFRLDGCWVVSEVENIPDQEWGDPDGVLKYPYEILLHHDRVGTQLLSLIHI